MAAPTSTGPVKDDSKKNQMHLIPAKPLLLVGEAFTGGAKKYVPWNYRFNGGLSRMRLFGSLLRHAYAWAAGEDKDKDSGLHPLSHCAAVCLMIMDLDIDGIGTDDRKAPK